MRCLLSMCLHLQIQNLGSDICIMLAKRTTMISEKDAGNYGDWSKLQESCSDWTKCKVVKNLQWLVEFL